MPEFLAAVRALRPVPGLDVLAGVEAKMPGPGRPLDLPDGLAGADAGGVVLIADHQFPGDAGPVHPPEVRDAPSAARSPRARWSSTASGPRSRARWPWPRRPQLAHLFSILPKMGLDESSVPDHAIAHLARQARIAGARLEVNEKWACPSARAVRAFAQAGVHLVASTDSHDCRDIGVYAAVRRIADGAFSGVVP